MTDNLLTASSPESNILTLTPLGNIFSSNAGRDNGGNGQASFRKNLFQLRFERKAFAASRSAGVSIPIVCVSVMATFML